MKRNEDLHRQVLILCGMVEAAVERGASLHMSACRTADAMARRSAFELAQIIREIEHQDVQA